MEVLTPEELANQAEAAWNQGNLVGARALFEQVAAVSNRIEILHHLASICFELGDLESAINHLNRAVKQDPFFFEGLEGLATIYHVRGNNRRALEFQEQAVQLRPNDVAAITTMAKLNFELKQFASGRRFAERALNLSPGHKDAQLLLAKIEHGDGRVKEAIAAYEMVLSRNPAEVEALIGLGNCALAVQNYTRAREVFEAAVGQVPRSADGWSGLAQIYVLTKDLPAALAALRRCVELFPEDADFAVELACALQESGQTGEAKQVAEDVLLKFGNLPGILAKLGSLFFRLKDYERAQMLLQQAIAADPSDIKCFETLGYAYFRQKNFLPALRCFKKVWNERPLAWGSIFNMAVVYTVWGLSMLGDGRFAFHWSLDGIELGRRARSGRFLDLGRDAYDAGNYDAAAAYYARIRENDGNFEVACAWLANCRLKQGRLAEATEAVNRGLARSPASAPLLALLGTLCLAQEKPHNAIRILKKSLELSSGQGLGWMTIGRAYHKTGAYQDALAAYDKAVGLNVNDLTIFRHIGDAAMAIDDRQRAVDAYRRGLERNPRDLVGALRMVECLFVGRQYEEAIQVCRHALAVDARCYTAYYWLGRIYRQIQSYNSARESLEKAIAISPKAGYLYRELGSLFEQVKDGYEACDAYEAALKINKEDGEAQKGLARARRMIGMR